MRKTSFTEWLLSLEIGTERASAVLGDLEELAVTRGRLWFWAMYLRAVLSFSWRTALSAFLTAYVCSRIFSFFLIPLLFRLPHHLSDPGLFGQENMRFSMAAWNLSIATSQILCFLLPFVAFRYGWRHITRIAAILFVLAVAVYCWTPWIRDLSALLIVAVALSALAMPRWRRPTLTLLLAAFTANAVSFLCFLVLMILFRHSFAAVVVDHPNLLLLRGITTFAVAALVCIRREMAAPPRQSSPAT